MNVYSLAKELHKFAYEVEALPPEEFAYWIAHYKIANEEDKRRQQEAEAKAKAQAGKRRR